MLKEIFHPLKLLAPHGQSREDFTLANTLNLTPQCAGLAGALTFIPCF